VPSCFDRSPAFVPMTETMKNNDNYLGQGVSWNEFKVVVRNNSRAVRIEKHTLTDNECDFRVQVAHNTRENILDAEPVLYYTYKEDDQEFMNEFRVKRNNERFGFSVENPSDMAYRQPAAH
jgi:hypothetical protein